MGQVISITDATRVASGDPALTFIDECYARLAALPDFTVRSGQKELSYKVCQALVCGEPLAAEAPTGTGKTIAYLIGAVAASERLRTLKDIPVVVATATVGLQTQILAGDLPALVRAGIVQQGEAILAKGRSRYFCAQNAERLTGGGSSSSQVDFFDEEGNQEAVVLEDVEQMLDLWRNNVWSGELDTYVGVPSLSWPRVAATSETCVGNKCAHYNTCPFFNARRAMSSAKIIVANHNLVLSDLSMHQEGMDPLFPGSKYLVVFDEAHHLPDKALEAGAAKLDFHAVTSELARVVSFVRTWQRQPEFAKLFERQKLTPGDFEVGALFNALYAAKEQVLKAEVAPDTFQARFEGGVLPPEIHEPLTIARVCCESLSTAMRDATNALKQSTLADRNPALSTVQVDLLFQAAGLNSLFSSLLKTLDLLLATQRAVRWLFCKDTAAELHVSPLEGADVLKDLLWSSERVHVAMVSATLRDFEGFERFKARVGAPDSLRTYTLPHSFPYEKNMLYLVDMEFSPRQEHKAEFQEELRTVMPSFIDATEGTLVLFPSRSLMSAVVPELRAQFADAVLCQGDLGIKELLKKHKERIDDGKGSILCGLATMAEGLDLPGNYCTHVAICTLPFTVPTSPVERELQDTLGKAYFEKRALPDALVKLIQMVGRLMRRESDRGRITIFDKRIYYSQWGRKMLNAVPGFRRKVVAPGYSLSAMQQSYKPSLAPVANWKSA